MPNHYSNALFVTYIDETDEDTEDHRDRFVAAMDGGEWEAWVKANPCERLMPCPAVMKHENPTFMTEAEMQWVRSNWGTKWGLYGADKPVPLSGDGAYYILRCSTAWGPPSDALRALLIADLADKLCAKVLSWVACDPCDDSFQVIDHIAKQK